MSAGLFLWQCSENPVATSDDPGGRSVPANQLTRSKEIVVESSNKFGLKLFREINQQEGDKNIFISPLSVSMALGMTYNGANGSTRAAMAQTLELAGLTLEEINESYRHLIDLLIQLDPQVQFNIANSIWYKVPFLSTPETDFLNLCQQYFDALVTGLDFSSPDAASTINAWVEESTNGKIEEIVDDPIDPQIVMFLINAIYFKGNWTYQFDESQTQDELFYLLDGSTTTCQMMSQKALHRYLFNEDFQAIDMLYGHGAYSMTFFVPGEHTNINALIALFEPENLNNWLSQFSTDSVNVFIPRFELEYDRELKDDLTTLGMGIAFDRSRANFSKMYQIGNVWISKVKHKTFVEVNEQGTEAAAVTDVEMMWESLGSPVFRADRPFLFMIRENESETILFIGKITDPTAG
jgi:serpin B